MNIFIITTVFSLISLFAHNANAEYEVDFKVKMHQDGKQFSYQNNRSTFINNPFSNGTCVKTNVFLTGDGDYNLAFACEDNDNYQAIVVSCSPYLVGDFDMKNISYQNKTTGFSVSCWTTSNEINKPQWTFDNQNDYDISQRVWGFIKFVFNFKVKNAKLTDS